MNKKLFELSEKVKRKEKLDVILDDLYITKDEMQGRIYDIRADLADEEQDVIHLEGFSLQGLWLGLLGRKDEQLEIEKQDVYNAQLQLAAAENEMAILEKEIARYEDELESLGDCEEEFREELDRRINSISFSRKLSEEDKVVVIEKTGELAAREKEIREAMEAGRQALNVIGDIYASLKSAKDWSVADMLTDSMIMTMVKRDKMHAAQDGIYRLQQSLTHFKSELTDVTVEADISVVTDDFLDIADFWLDGLFIDWMVHDRIKRAESNVADTEKRIKAVMSQLGEKLTEVEQEKRILKKYL